jgi:ABC-type multidrug transport system ATPase subunit
MPIRSVVLVGSAPDCDIRVTGPDVQPRHAKLTWREGLWVQNLGAARTMVDGRPLDPDENAPLAGFHSSVFVAGERLTLTGPEVSRLILERTALPFARPGVLAVGRDPSRANVLIQHPSVSGLHLEIDAAAGTITDVGSSSGTFDRGSQRLPLRHPVPLDRGGGYFLGPVWIATEALLELTPPATRPGAGPHPPANAGEGPGAAPPPPATPAGPNKHRTMFGTFDFAGAAAGPSSAAAVIGRQPTCDIVLPYPQVSSRHASLARVPGERMLRVTDLGSVNGTYVNGRRLTQGQAEKVAPDTRIFIGPYPVKVTLDGDAVLAYADVEQEPAAAQAQAHWSGNLVEIEARDLFVEVPDRDNPGAMKVLLNRVTFKALPGDLIALMGPSGAGKTTLLTVLNGYLRPQSGEVRINGESLSVIYDALRGSIGYVPQDDLLHPELTVRQAITYSARFRLPADFTDEEIERRVHDTMKSLALENLANTVIGSPVKKTLSGGQRKRVNIALELVTDPALMFLDEPTSGLAADDTVTLIDLLAEMAKKTGKTIIVTIHQPAREEYEKFNLAFIMGFGGEPIYFGPTGKPSYDFFARYQKKPIDNPRDMFDQLKVREDAVYDPKVHPNRSAARLAAAKLWRQEFYRPDNPTQVEMYSGRRQPGQPGQNRPPTRVRPPLTRQLRLLLSRYLRIKLGDKVGLAILLLQAPIIGGLLAAVFYDPPDAPNLWCQNYLLALERALPPGACQLTPQRFASVRDYKGALFFLTVGAIWFGTSNAAREIVSEIAIYRRERMVNLSIANYVLSKFVVLSALCVVQCTVLLGIVYPALHLGNDQLGAFLPLLGTMVVTAMCAVALGLLLSTVVATSEAAMALTPIALIPQVVLGGLLVPMTNRQWLRYVMAAMPSRWSFEGIMGAERDALRSAPGWRIETCLPDRMPGVYSEGGRAYFDCAVHEIASTTSRGGAWGFSTWDQPAVALGVLGGMTLVMLLTVALLLRRRDSV